MANLENERIIKNEVAPTGLSFVAMPNALLKKPGGGLGSRPHGVDQVNHDKLKIGRRSSRFSSHRK